MKSLKIILITALICASCQKKYDDASTNKISGFIKQIGQTQHFSDAIRKIYFINADQGCETCIDKCLQFAHSQQQNPNMLFVILSSFDNTISKVKQQYGLRLGKDSHVFFDKGLMANKDGLVDVFPVVYYIDDKRVARNLNIDASNIDDVLVVD